MAGHFELEVPLRHSKGGVEKAAEYLDRELWGEVQAGAINVNHQNLGGDRSHR